MSTSQVQERKAAAAPNGLAAERQYITATKLTPVPCCANCAGDSCASSFVDSANVCERCAKAGYYLRAAVEAPDALRKLADELEDAISERHELTALTRLARVVDALAEQIEAVVEVTEAMATRRQRGAPAFQYPPNRFSLFGRGVWKAPWMGPNGEMVLVAITAERTLLDRPVVLPFGSDYLAAADRLQSRLDGNGAARPRRVERAAQSARG